MSLRADQSAEILRSRTKADCARVKPAFAEAMAGKGPPSPVRQMADGYGEAREVIYMLSSFLRIMFYDPDKGWVEDEIKDVEENGSLGMDLKADKNSIKAVGDSNP